MKNLTKSLLLLIIIFPLMILLSSVFAEKASAQTQQEITTCAVTCMDNNPRLKAECKFGDRYLPAKTVACQIAYDNCHSNCKNTLSSFPTPTPTLAPNPTQCAAQGGQCTSVNVACNSLGSYVWGGYGSPYCSDSTPQCCVPATPTPTLPTPTPDNSSCNPSPPPCGIGLTCVGGSCNISCPAEKPNKCSDTNKNVVCCNNSSTVTPTAPTSIPTPKLTWQLLTSCTAPTQIAIVLTPTPLPTPTPASAPTQCKTQSDCNNPPQCQQTANAKCDNGTCVYSALKNGTQCLLVSGVNGSCLNGTCKEGAPTKCEGNADGFTLQCMNNGCSPGQREQSQYACSSGQFCCGTALPTSIPTATPIPTAAFTTSCPTNSDGRCGAGTPPATNCTGLLYSAGTPISNCTKELPNCWSCPLPTPTPIPSAVCNDSNTVDNDCFKRNGIFCAVGSSCKQNPNNTTKDCTCQSTAPTVPPTPTPSPTPLPGSVQLALSVVQQGLTSTPVNPSRSVTAVLQGTDEQIVAKTGTVNFLNGTFNGTINLGVLPAGSYKLKVKVGNFLKSLISNLVVSGTAASAQTTVVAGLTDQFNDNVDAISFYANGLRTCFGSTLGVKKCGNPEDVDLNGDANVDVIDYQIYLKGIRSLKQGLPVL